jgi:hypothetical protein
VIVVAVIDPKWEHLQHGCSICSGLDPGVGALECFDEGLADPIALRASSVSRAV